MPSIEIMGQPTQLASPDRVAVLCRLEGTEGPVIELLINGLLSNVTVNNIAAAWDNAAPVDLAPNVTADTIVFGNRIAVVSDRIPA